MSVLCPNVVITKDTKFFVNPVLLIVLSTTLLLISFYIGVLWFLSLIGLIPLLIVLFNETISVQKRAIYAWLFGTSYMAGVLIWKWSTLPLDWVGISNPFFSALIVFVVWGLSALIAGLPFIFFSLLISKFAPKGSLLVVFVPAAWILCEFIRACLPPIIWYGPGALQGPHWTLGFLGYALAGSDTVINLASIGGIYLLSFCAVLVNALFFQFSVEISFGLKRYRHMAVVLLVILILLTPFSKIYSSSIQKPRKSEVSIAVAHLAHESVLHPKVQAKVDRVLDPLKVIWEIKKKNLKPDIVVMPEDSRLQRVVPPDKANEFFQKNLGERPVLIIDASHAEKEETKRISRYNFINTSKRISEYSSKKILIPFGEYVPKLIFFIAQAFGAGEWIKRLDSSKAGYKPGNEFMTATFKGYKIGSLFCGEIMSPNLYRKHALNGANLFTNAASHGMFHGSRALYKQIRQMAKVRAVEHDRYFIHAGNIVPSFVLSNTGELLSETSWDKLEVYESRIEMRNTETIYTRFGDWPVLFSALLVLFIILIGYFNPLAAIIH